MLLHTCCAPCSSAIIECMLQQGITPVIFYSNSNIFPLEEYLHRKDECTRYAESLGLEIVDDDYVHDDWRCHVARGLENEPERGARCLECFKYRLLRAAQYAYSHGFTVLTTTLASSRWKDLDQVNAAGLQACSLVNGSLVAAGDWSEAMSASADRPGRDFAFEAAEGNGRIGNAKGSIVDENIATLGLEGGPQAKRSGGAGSAGVFSGNDSPSDTDATPSETTFAEGFQLSLFQLDDPTLSAIRDDLKAADLDNMTPMQAFDLLRSMKAELGL